MYVNLSTVLIFVSFFVAGVFAVCLKDTIPVQSDFKIEQYAGTWYEQKWLSERYHAPEELYQDYSHTYVLSDDRQNNSVIIRGRDPRQLTTCFQHSGRLLTTSTSGKLVLVTGSGANTKVNTDYWVLSTDYKTFSLVFGCMNWDSNNICIKKKSWIWSRAHVLAADTMVTLESKATNNCINATMYLPTSHSQDCVTSDASSNRYWSWAVILTILLSTLLC